MKKRKITSIMSFLASVCFFLSYLLGEKETPIKLLLGSLWLCIGAMNLYESPKKK